MHVCYFKKRCVPFAILFSYNISKDFYSRRHIMKIGRQLSYGLIMLVSVGALWGCPKSAEVTATPEAPAEEAAPAPEQATDQQAEEEKRRASGSRSGSRAGTGRAGQLKVFNRFTLISTDPLSATMPKRS